jgi:predicted MFS family arabinose efflux permease
MFDKISVNKTIRTLIAADFFLLFATGLLTPIFAVFILDNITDRIEVIGYAVSIYWITRVVLVIPLSLAMDKIRGQADEFLFLITGIFMISVLPLFYIFASEPWHVYLVQVGNGIAHAMLVPAWRILFTKNVDRKIVGLEWSLEDFGVGVATAIAAILGAFIVTKYGFNALFFCISLFGFFSISVLLTLYNKKTSFIKSIFYKTGNKAPLKIDDLKN